MRINLKLAHDLPGVPDPQFDNSCLKPLSQPPAAVNRDNFFMAMKGLEKLRVTELNFWEGKLFSRKKRVFQVHKGSYSSSMNLFLEGGCISKVCFRS